MNEELGVLFRQAREYGRVVIHTMDNGKYFCRITFETVLHVSLEAKSSFDHLTPEDAVLAATVKAKEIVESLSKHFHKKSVDNTSCIDKDNLTQRITKL